MYAVSLHRSQCHREWGVSQCRAPDLPGSIRLHQDLKMVVVQLLTISPISAFPIYRETI